MFVNFQCTETIEDRAHKSEINNSNNTYKVKKKGKPGYDFEKSTQSIKKMSKKPKAQSKKKTKGS